MVPDINPPHGTETSWHGGLKATHFLLLLLGFSLALNVLLGWQVRSSKAHQHKAVDSSMLEEGALVAPLSVKTLEGVEQAISYADTDKPTVFYVFSLSLVSGPRATQTESEHSPSLPHPAIDSLPCHYEMMTSRAWS